MSLKILVDMSLSPDWVPLLAGHQHVAVHWSAVGPANADDSTIMAWAQGAGYVVFTHDLDFGTILALTHAVGPSVLQIRTQDVLPDTAGAQVVAALAQHDAELAAGAIVVIDQARMRVRVLPF
jgi:predicted nuclease of predicted toxin-antitoxin system